MNLCCILISCLNCCYSFISCCSCYFTILWLGFMLSLKRSCILEFFIPWVLVIISIAFRVIAIFLIHFSIFNLFNCFNSLLYLILTEVLFPIHLYMIFAWPLIILIISIRIVIFILRLLILFLRVVVIICFIYYFQFFIILTNLSTATLFYMNHL